MKKLNNELKQILNELHGNMLMIGDYDSKIADVISKNNNILFCDILSNSNDSKFTEDGNDKKQKTVNIRKLRKKYKKDKLNYLIVQENQIKSYKNIFVKDSIYITNKKIYVIPSNQNITFRMYKRYSKNIKIVDCLDGKIIEINVENVKNSKIKDFVYDIFERLFDLIDFIGNFLIN